MKISSFSLFLLLLFCSPSVYATPERPLLFLPGILGSKLYKSTDDNFDKNDLLLWGDLSSYRKFNQLELKKGDNIIPHGIVESVQILGPIRINQYKTLIDYLESLGYEKGRSLFLFSYDWRKSNFYSAEKLNSFIERCKLQSNGCEKLADGKFDMLAHSMGGLVGRIFLDQHRINGERTENFITLGTPYLGSLSSSQLLIEGFSGLERFMAGQKKLTKRVVLSFESGFELAPTYANCCFMGDSWESAIEFTFTSPLIWEKLLPEGDSYSDWKQHIGKGVSRKIKISSIVKKKSSASIYPIAASNVRTAGAMLLNKKSKILKWHYTRGDGTVPIISASNKVLEKARVSMKKHSHIFSDKYVEETLRRILLAKNEPVFFSSEYTSCLLNSSEQCFYISNILAKSSNLRIVPGIIAPFESTVARFDIELDDGDETKISIFPRICVSHANDKSEDCIVNTKMRWDSGDEMTVRSFTSPISLEGVGDYKAAVFVEDQEVIAEYFSVVEIDK